MKAVEEFFDLFGVIFSYSNCMQPVTVAIDIFFISRGGTTMLVVLMQEVRALLSACRLLKPSSICAAGMWVYLKVSTGEGYCTRIKIDREKCR